MTVMDIVREVKEFREAIARGTLSVCDGFELASAIAEVGMEYTCGPRPVGSEPASSSTEALASELTMLIEDLGGALPVIARSEGAIEIGAGVALVKLLLPIALKILAEWLSKQQTN